MKGESMQAICAQRFTVQNQAVSPKTNNRQNSSGNVTFKGGEKNSSIGSLKTGVKALLIGACTSFISLWLAHCEEQIGPMPKENQVEWDKNTCVYASCSQNNRSYGKFTSDFWENLKESNSLNETYEKSKVYKLKCMNFFPFAERHAQKTPNSDFDSFNLKDKDKHRFIIAFSDPSEDRFFPNAKKFANGIKDKFNLPDGNVFTPICEKGEEGKAYFKKYLKQVGDKIMKQKLNPENVELMLYYSGHGCKFSGGSSVEGTDTGLIMGMNEIELRSYLKNIPGLSKAKKPIVLDTCHSGAWIAEAAKDGRAKMGGMVGRFVRMA